MTAGFAHFDGAHRENFAAALILLAVDSDPHFRAAFTSLIRRHSGLTTDAGLDEWGREETLDTGSERKRRSDIWLRFEDGLVLVEIKTHSRWNAVSVAQQLRDQRQAKDVREAILLAPTALLRRCREFEFPKVAWYEFFDAIDAIQEPGGILRLAQEHWSQNVERDFGLPAGASVVPFEAAVAQTGCLVAFLQAAICRLGGKVQGNSVYFSSPDGRPSQRKQWAWIGTAIPGRIPSVGDAYIGIYTYTVAPPGESIGTFIEVYRKGEHDKAIVSAPFNPNDLSSEGLDCALEHFLREYENATARP